MLSPSRGVRSAKYKVFAVSLRIALLLLPLFALAAPREAQAYQWMLKHGYPSCGACHTDPSGGELLTFYGRMQSEVTLSMPWGGAGGSAYNTKPKAPRLARDPSSFAAHAKLADKEGEGEKVELAEDPPAEAKATDGAAAAAEGEAAKPAEDDEEEEEEAAPAPAPAPAAEEDDGLSGITPFLFGLWTPPDWLLLGGSYRHMNIIKPGGDDKFKTFPMMLDVYGQMQFGSFKLGGSIGGARVPGGSPYARAAQVTTGQGDSWNLISRTHYVGYDVSSELQLRLGRLQMPFGVRIPEHTMWVRQYTRTDRESSQQDGVSVNYSGESFRFEVLGIAGNYQISPDKFRERGYSAYFEYFPNPKTAVGLNSLITVAKDDRFLANGKKMTRQAHGAMLRAAVSESVVFVAELDGLLRSNFDPGYVGFTQIDWEATQGLHFMATGEILDEGYSKDPTAPARAPGAGKPKLGAWLSASWWFLPHFDVRIDGVARQEDDFSILAQLHVYL
jgi:hypothetical protein